jgi:hypothetical protein
VLLLLQAAAARAALEAEQSLVGRLKEEASISAQTSAQLLELEQQVSARVRWVCLFGDQLLLVGACWRSH